MRSTRHPSSTETGYRSRALPGPASAANAETGASDVPTDAYHRGFKGYRWLLERLGPTLWLHGHTPLAAARDWKVQVGNTAIVNVTGAIVIDLLPPKPGAVPARRGRGRSGSRSSESDLPTEPTAL